VCYEGVAKEKPPKSNKRKAERDMMVERDGVEKNKKNLKKAFINGVQ